MPKPRERTPFGDRLFTARSHAKLTQTQLAKAAGISQSTLGELEYIGDGSSATVPLATACGVRPEWLATGAGEMLDTYTWPFQRVRRERLLALSTEQRSYVEGRLLSAIEEAETPPSRPALAVIESDRPKFDHPPEFDASPVRSTTKRARNT